MDKKLQMFWKDKWNIVLSVISIFVIAVVGTVLLYADRMEQNVIILPEKEYVDNRTSEENIKDIVININTAPKEELMLISGIGESKADAIIAYREKKLFEKPEDIMKIKGFGEKTYEKIADQICVE